MRAVRLLLLLLLIALSSGGLCPTRWLLFRDRCLGVYPVWASWSSAETLCAQSDSHLVSLHSNKDVEFLREIVTKLTVPIWTGGYSVSQSDLWFWSDGSDFSRDIWTNRTLGSSRRDEACLGLTVEDGEVRSAPCGELRFYICSRKTSWESVNSNDGTVVSTGLSPGVSLFALMWEKSETVAEDILHSSSFLRQLMSGSITQSCYDLFSQQEALYMGLVYRTLEASVFFTQEADPGVQSLLLDAKEFYQTNYSKQDLAAAPQWLQFALQSFHFIAADDPLYLLVALSARSALNSFVLQSVPLPGSKVSPESKNLSLKWREESESEEKFAHRFRKLIEHHQSEMDVFKSINIFRVHMMNQKSLHKHVECQQ